MFTVAAVLPFTRKRMFAVAGFLAVLPLIAGFLPFFPLAEDAMIRQLGDDDLTKRESATRFLDKILEDTDGVSNYWMLKKVKDARSNQNQEIRKRAERIYIAHRSKYVIDHSCFFAVFKIEQRDHKSLQDKLYNIFKVFSDTQIHYGGLHVGNKHWANHLFFVTEKCTPDMLYQIRNQRGFQRFVPFDNVKKWAEVAEAIDKENKNR
jgi:hypothetical protein